MIRGFPTLMFFDKGRKKYNTNKEYEGHRVLNNLENWAL